MHCVQHQLGLVFNSTSVQVRTLGALTLAQLYLQFALTASFQFPVNNRFGFLNVNDITEIDISRYRIHGHNLGATIFAIYAQPIKFKYRLILIHPRH